VLDVTPHSQIYEHSAYAIDGFRSYRGHAMTLEDLDTGRRVDWSTAGYPGWMPEINNNTQRCIPQPADSIDDDDNSDDVGGAGGSGSDSGGSGSGCFVSGLI
jgi:hypothetical protein